MYLLADSQLLFWRTQEGALLDGIRGLTGKSDPLAAYIGASNDDAPEFYDIFTAAMDGIGIRRCRMLEASFPPAARSFLEEADIVLLAGGDVERGYKVMTQTGMSEIVTRRYLEGAVVIGVSAGAVQLGKCAFLNRGESCAEMLETLNLFPHIVSVHDEKQQWESLANIVRLLDGAATGLGIPSGGGVIYHPDGSLETVRHPADVFTMKNGVMIHGLLLPQA